MEAAFKGDRVGVVEEGVEDAAIEGGIADHIVLVLDGGLVGGGGVPRGDSGCRVSQAGRMGSRRFGSDHCA